jgi:pimeloyl-ACP methyl ester carboxylesterase
VKSPRHFTCVAALAIAASAAGVQIAAAQTTASHTFRVFVRGVDMGIEEVTVMESVDGWTLRGSGKLRAPVNLAMDYWEARYDRAWKPIELTINLTESAKQWTVRTTFQGTTASSDITQDGQTQRRTSAVATDTIVLPNLIFGAYEALAARLASEKVGSQLQVFIAPQDALSATIHNVTDETIKLPGRIISARRWTLHLGGGAAKLEMDVWTEGSRLLRVDIPTQMLTVLRDDIASVSARLVTLARPNDEEVSIPANGFSLAATISRPVATPEPAPTPGRKPAPVRLPAVVLISGSGPTDREEFVAGIPIFAQLANALADAGYLVVRYDERGAGLSGGRQESATIEEFAVDARAVVTYLMKRRDVDPKKVSLVGYGEGGWIALLVAAREQKIAAVALIATPSTPGTELVLEQQRLMFERGTTTSPAVQQAAIDQQKKILEAVVTGKGWENFNPDMRKRVDTPLYRSFLMFEPAAAIVKVRQPMLVVQPMLDREVPAYHGEQLAQLARSRPRAGPTAFVQLTGVNHLLARATTGEIAEYGTLTQRSVSPAATLELTSWLAKALVPERSK